ncbi:MAG: hypothetical protein KF746_17475 [Chitinophagaceae bacterium]|nr:hypothetical protein [Chitinophagaceae bacterium]
MKRVFARLVCLGILVICTIGASAQCSICTKTAQQMGEAPAKALNAGIIYLALVPFAAVGVIIYRWWRSHRS